MTVTINKKAKGKALGLPSYQKPPVIEVVCAVTLAPLKALRIPHFGSYWNRIRDEFPQVEHRDPLGTVTGELLTELPLPRVWFIHKTGNAIIQVQSDRFIYNWRKEKAEDNYPRYGSVVASFKAQFETFRKFAAEEGLGDVVPVAAELAYINHIERRAADGLEDVSEYFPDLVWRKGTDRFLPVPSNVSWRGAFEYPDHGGRLTADIKSATRVVDQAKIYILELRATGKIPDADASPETLARCFGWMDKAREWIVRGFADLTSEQAQTKLWLREGGV